MNSVVDTVRLASASPRRRQLLEQIGVRFLVTVADIDESRLAGEAPPDYVQRLACAKAEHVWRQQDDLPVLAADTTVALGDEIFGKPGSQQEAMAMLESLSGRTHEVLTAVALRYREGLAQRLSRTQVTFRATTAAERDNYWCSGEPLGKAGGYAIQGRAAVFTSHLNGSFSGVMGLPLFETAQLLQLAGVVTRD